MIAGAELNYWRRELRERLLAHPIQCWSPALLKVVVDAIDLELGAAGDSIPSIAAHAPTRGEGAGHGEVGDVVCLTSRRRGARA
jgi:hypothetical protein